MSDGANANLQEALKAAASAAAVGAAVGAARAYTSRRHEADVDEPEQAPADEECGHEPEAEEESPEPEHESPEATHEQPEPEPEPEPAPAEPVSADGAGDIVAEARRLLRDLHGSEAESVSSIARSRDGWVVGFEVVELRRIPDSTDVLATYEVELSGNGHLVRLERGRRYHRSEAGGGRRS